MVDLTDRIPFSGTAGTRGIEGVRILRETGEPSGRFEQNEVEIVVHQDSTERELMWQYEAKRLSRGR